MRLILRTMLIALTAVVGLAAVGAGGTFYWLRTSLPQIDGVVMLPGLANPVEVIRDGDGIPHIYAGSLYDAYLALGYIHAQDRLWQMEMMRRVGAGRLAEIFGSRAIDIDRFARLFGFHRSAQEQVAAMDTDGLAVLEAYAAGVNAFLDQRRGALPPEFLVLRHVPEQWTPADSLVWGRIMAFRLSTNWRQELLRLRMSRVLDTERILELWPDDPPHAPVTIPEAARAAYDMLDHLWHALPEAFEPMKASNAWAIAGNRTVSGAPILANDPHLGFDAPILWYLARMVTPSITLTGATVPGVPLMVLGHNERIAWGMTTTGGDTEDLYLTRLDPADPSRYVGPEGLAEFAIRHEEIQVRGENSVALAIRETRHGPVISDAFGDVAAAADGPYVIALASAALAPEDATPQALFAINRARNWPEFLEATRDFHSPQQNLFYAGTDNRIGIVVAGRIPVRQGHDGRFPVEADKPDADWTGFIPFDAVPRSETPASGLIANANNRVVGPEYPYLITKDWEGPYRAERILEAIGDRRDLSLEDSATLQLDLLSPVARRLVPLITAIEPEDATERRVVEKLRGWDFRKRRDQPEPLIFATWYRELIYAIAGDELGGLIHDYVRRASPDFIEKVLREESPWCDDVTTPERESCADQLHRSLARTVEQLRSQHGRDPGAWRWGAVHQAFFPHQVFTHIPVARRYADLSIATDGGDETLNRGQTGGSPTAPFLHRHGAGLRAVYDLADLSQSRFVIATGQSGNPLSPHYRDMLERWRDGGYVHIAGDRNAAIRQAAGVLALQPMEPLRAPTP